jgi:hypothetical protein
VALAQLPFEPVERRPAVEDRMNQQAQNDLVMLAVKRAQEAVKLVTQLADTHELDAKIQLGVMTALANDLATHLRSTLIHGALMPPELVNIKVLTMLGKCLGIESEMVDEEQGKALAEYFKQGRR